MKYRNVIQLITAFSLILNASFAQTLDFSTLPTTLGCNPMVAGFAWQDFTLRTTFGSPQFVTNSGKSAVELTADQSTTGTYEVEGFSITNIVFKANIAYKVTITAGGENITAPNLAPYLNITFSSHVPFQNDNCGLGNLPSFSVNDFSFQNQLSLNENTYDYYITPTADITGIYFYSSPVQIEPASLIIKKIVISSGSGAAPPPPSGPPPQYSTYSQCTPGCCSDATLFCTLSQAASTGFTAPDPYTLNCDAFRHMGPGPDYIRTFVGSSITLAPGFVAIPQNSQGVVFISSDKPCYLNTASVIGLNAKGLSFGEASPEAGVADKDATGQFLLYPNPSNGSFALELETNITNDVIQIEIIDNTGRLLKRISTQPKSKKIILDEMGLANGIYYVRVIQNSRIFVKKLVIAR